ncbi:MAG: hypothetical protein C0493_03685 [Kytococcus sp.]|nr:hypothetical protein [Kytococcus sp.]
MAHEPLLAAEVGEHLVEEGGALPDALLQPRPLGRAEGQRERVELPLARLRRDLRPLGGVAALRGDPGAVGDAVVGDEAAGAARAASSAGSPAPASWSASGCAASRTPSRVTSSSTPSLLVTTSR